MYSFSQEECSLMFPQIYFLHITKVYFIKSSEIFIAQMILSMRHLHLVLPIINLHASSVQRIKKIKENYFECSIGIIFLERKSHYIPKLRHMSHYKDVESTNNTV